MKQTSLEAVLPLSPLQEGMLFHAVYDDEGIDFYNMQSPLELTGELDVPVLRQSCDALLRRHSGLRAGFLRRRSGEAIQAIARAVELPWEEIDLTGFGPAEQQSRLDRLLTDDRGRRFDMTTPPLVRFTLVKLAADRHVLVLTNHHILADGWSLPIVLRDLFRIYRQGGDASALEPAAPFADYLGWLAAQDRDQAERAWRTALSGVDEPTLVAPGTTATGARQQRVQGELPAELTTQLTAAARARSLTMNTLIQGAWALILSQLTGRRDVVFGATVAGRPAAVPGVDGMVGLLINTVPVRVRIDPDEPLTALLERVQDEQSRLSGYQYLGLADIHRATGRSELFDTTVAFENYPIHPAAARGVVPGLRIAMAAGTVADTPEGTHYPLSLAVYPGSSLRFELNHRQDVVTGDQAQALLGRLRSLLETIVARPEIPAGDVDLLTADERQKVLYGWNDTARVVPKGTFPQLFEDQVRRTPEAVAVVSGTQQLTFAQVNSMANHLARELVGYGVGPERFVALAMPRSPMVVVAIMAILKSGAVYVPIDLDHPADRIAAMFDEITPSVVLTTKSLESQLPDGPPRLCLDEHVFPTIAGHDLRDAERISPLSSANLAYVIYTSGSTGRPKGVAVEHRNLVNMFHSHNRNFFTPEARSETLRVALTNSLVFDASWSQLLWMVGGHELHLVDDDTRKDPHALVDYTVSQGIDVLDITPTFARQMISAGLFDRPLRTLALGGEAVGDTMWTELRDVSTSVYNLYGPAECTIDAMFCRVADSDHPVIGQAADNLRTYILDDRLRPVPPEVDGELYIAGDGLARGYFARPGLSAERFVADPFGAPGSRMYRTGDRGRWELSGHVVFAGRVDHQVKIRGFRVELGEIEAVLAPDVDQVAVIVREDTPGTKRLVAYVVPKEFEVDALRERAAAALPDYMVPSAFVGLDALPLTVNNKLDTAALPAPKVAAGAASRAPRNEREQVLCALFAEVLGAERVGIDDSFFDLGGDSIVSMRLAAQARKASLGITPKDIFTHRTVAELAVVARDLTSQAVKAIPQGPLLVLTTAEKAELDAKIAGGYEVAPLTPLQAGMHFHALLKPDGVDPYVTQRPLELTGELSTKVLRAAFNSLLERHANLRAGFVQLESGRSVQVMPSNVELPWNECDLTAFEPDEQRVRLNWLLAEDRRCRFDLTAAPLLRVTLVRLAEDRHLLLLTHHHILLDGWSLPLMFRDLFSSYARGGTSSSPVAPFRDYLAWLSLQDRKADEEAWGRALAALDEPTVVAPGAEEAEVPIPSLVADVMDATAITLAARAAGVTVNTVVQVAWAIVVGLLTGRRDVVFGTTVAGRPADLPGAENMVGLLMNTVPVRVRLDPNESLGETITRTQVAQAEVLGHHHVGLADIQRIAGLGELFDTVVGFENTPVDRDAVQEQVPGLRIGLDKTPAPGATHYPLSLVVVPGDELSLELNYRDDLYPRAAASGLLGRLRRVLDTFVDAPDTLLGRMELRTSEERALLDDWSVGATEAPAATIVDLFERQVTLTPDAPAVVAPDETLTYAELNARANQLARVLIERGIGPERLVAVALPKSRFTAVAFLAVLKAGAAHLPVDVAYPPDRIEFMLTDSRPDLVLVTRSTAFPGPLPQLVLDEVVPDGDSSDVDVRKGLSSAAYVIYTSGSTGRPKGVVVTHNGVASMVAATQDKMDVKAGGRVLLFSSPSFDASIWELCTALLTGACAVVAPAEQLLPGDALVDTIARYDVNCLLLPPSSLAVMPDGGLPDGATLVVGGEACAPDLVERWSVGRRMVNAYGPTESTVMATLSDPLSGRRAPSMGKPVVGSSVYVLDDCLRPTPVGVLGEVYIAGAGLARGYLNRAGLTAERFVANPFGAPGERMYRSGDLAQWNESGQLEYLGRADHQVKVRGFRIELGEIESVLRADPAVHQAVVAVREDDSASKRLVAYVVGADVDMVTLQDRAAAALPAYMVPSAFVELTALPVTPSGKLDRKALPAPEFVAAENSRPPRDEREEVLCALFAEVLKVEKVGIDDSFFALGGDSIMSTQLVTRARKAGLDISPKDVFVHKTVAELAEVAETLTGEPDEEETDDLLLDLDQDELDEFAASLE